MNNAIITEPKLLLKSQSSLNELKKVDALQGLSFDVMKALNLWEVKMSGAQLLDISPRAHKTFMKACTLILKGKVPKEKDMIELHIVLSAS